MKLPIWLAAYVSFASLLAFPIAAHSAGGELEIRAVDADTKQLIPVRMHLKNSRGRAIVPKNEVGYKDHFAFNGKTILELPIGMYTFEMERGPEYRIRQGYFTIERGATDNKTVEMQRFVDMKKEGWWSGDLHVHRDLEDIRLLMMAEDLHVAPVITWWNEKNLWEKHKIPENLTVNFDTNRYYHCMAGEDERGGGALLYLNLKTPLPITGSQREYPSPVKFLKMARGQENCHVDIEKPFWWDMPIWVASRMTHSIGIAHNHMWRDSVLDNEAWGKPRDKFVFPGKIGNGQWTLRIYYHLLNSGIKLPPSAGSASGVLPNPVGYNRVYVHCGEEMTYEKWFEGLRRGQVIVTNGPMIRNPRANGHLPGHTFQVSEGQQVELSVSLNLSLREKVDYLEIVKNGAVVHEVRLDQWAKANGKLPPIIFKESGWMLIRAVTNNSKTFRFAMTGPYYVRVGDQPRISKTSAKFFLDWVHQRAKQLKIDDEQQREEVVSFHRGARDFWQKLVDNATAD